MENVLPISGSEQANHADLDQALRAASGVNLNQLVELCIRNEASDIHFGTGKKIALRIRGKIVFAEGTSTLSRTEVEAITVELLPNEIDRKRLEHARDFDFSFTHPTGVSFRVNAFHQRGETAFVMRMIPKNVPAPEALGIPALMTELVRRPSGLILVAGSGGSGKSMTIQSLLENLNETSVRHVITIENPIEYLFADRQSFFTQREVGKDTLTFSNALESAVREDPDVIVVSEVIDADTLSRILTVTETGNLVIAAMTCRDAVQALDRMISFYPETHQKQVRTRLADNLLAVLSQDLLDRSDGKGRAAVFELLINNDSIKNLIRTGNLSQIPLAIRSGRGDGMISKEGYASDLASRGVITSDAAGAYRLNE